MTPGWTASEWEFKGQERKLKQLVSGSGLCIRDKPLPGVGESATEAQVGLHCPFRLRLRLTVRVRPHMWVLMWDVGWRGPGCVASGEACLDFFVVKTDNVPAPEELRVLLHKLWAGIGHHLT